MITREVREWIQKVERAQYSYEDAMYEFMRFSSFLTREEMKMLKNKLENSFVSPRSNPPRTERETNLL